MILSSRTLAAFVCAAALGLGVLAGCGNSPSGDVEAGKVSGSNGTGGAAATGGTAVAAGAESLFQQKCANCHGMDGKSGNAPRIAGTGESREEIVNTILKGHGRMPAVQGLDQAQAEQIADYVKGLPAG